MTFSASSPSSDPLLPEQELWEEQPRERQQHPFAIKRVKRKPVEGIPRRGRVLEGTGRWWLVELEEPAGELLECTVAGTLVAPEESPTLIAVGDVVECLRTEESAPGGLPQGMIVMVHPRRTKLARYRRREGKEQVIASNVDQLIILQAVAQPPYDRFLIDRYLIAAEKGDLQPVLCINKLDLGSADQVREELRYYAEVLGIRLILCSAQTGEGIDELRAVLTGKTSVLSGPSGVGKSTLTNLLLGSNVQQVGPISPKLGQGRQTTTMARMFRLPGGGYIIDTPGIRELTIWELTREELPAYFPDFEPWAQECAYQPCSHIHEPDCAVRSAAARGQIDPVRYEHYCRLWHSLPKHAYQWRQRRHL